MPTTTEPMATEAATRERRASANQLRRIYRGEHWDTLGKLNQVSIDVYLALVCQVGGIATLVAHHLANTATGAATDATAEGAAGLTTSGGTR